MTTAEALEDGDVDAFPPAGDALTGDQGPADTDNWAPPESVAACSAALQRMDGFHLTDLGITSAIRGEGRSTLARAAALVQRFEYGRRTVLVDLDLAAPSLADSLDLHSKPGVAEYVRGECPLDSCIQWVDAELGVLVAGSVQADAVFLQSRIPDAGLRTELAALCDTTVVDLPPLPPAGAGTLLARSCSSLLFVVRAGVTPLPDVERALDLLGKRPPVILNGKRRPSGGLRRRLRRG